MCGVQHVQCKVLPVLPSRQHLKHWKHLYILRKSQYVCVCLFFLVSRMTRMILPARCAVVEAALTTFSWSDSSFFYSKLDSGVKNELIKQMSLFDC